MRQFRLRSKSIDNQNNLKFNHFILIIDLRGCYVNLNKKYLMDKSKNKNAIL